MVGSVRGVWQAMANGFSINSGIGEIDQLLSRRHRQHAVFGCAFGLNVVAGDQCIALVLPRGLAPTDTGFRIERAAPRLEETVAA